MKRTRRQSERKVNNTSHDHLETYLKARSATIRSSFVHFQVRTRPVARDGQRTVAGVMWAPPLASSLSTRHYGDSTNGNGAPMKKLLLLAILGGVGYLVYRQYMASQAEQDLWAEATAAPDLR